MKSCNVFPISDSNEVEEKVKKLVSLFNSLGGEVDKHKLVHPDLKKKEGFARVEVMDEAFLSEKNTEGLYFMIVISIQKNSKMLTFQI